MSARTIQVEASQLEPGDKVLAFDDTTTCTEIKQVTYAKVGYWINWTNGSQTYHNDHTKWWLIINTNCQVCTNNQRQAEYDKAHPEALKYANKR